MNIFNTSEHLEMVKPVNCMLCMFSTLGGAEGPQPGCKRSFERNCHPTSYSLEVLNALGKLNQLKELNQYLLGTHFGLLDLNQKWTSCQPRSSEAHKAAETISIRQTFLECLPCAGDLARPRGQTGVV